VKRLREMGRIAPVDHDKPPVQPRIAIDRAPHIAAKRRTPAPALAAKPVEAVAVVESKRVPMRSKMPGRASVLRRAYLEGDGDRQ
jgi:hypothetical protein